MSEPAAELVGRIEFSGDGRIVVGEVARTSAGLVVARVSISTELSGGVTHEMLRGVPLGEILAEARSRAALAESLAALPIRIPPPRHATMTDEVLRDVARAYLEECASNGRGVTGRMQDRFGRPQGTILTWITRARREGWLGPGVRGRLGAEPGPKLIAWAAKVVNCETCKGEPPPGFACQACGAQGQETD